MRVKTRTLSAISLGFSTLLLMSCGAPRYVSVHKSVQTVINDVPMTWKGDDSDSAAGGFNQIVLRDMLQTAQIDPLHLVIDVTNDGRKCVHGYSSVVVAGNFEYQGFRGSFQMQQERRYHVGSSTPSPKVIRGRCNALASELIVLGIAKAVRQAPPTAPPPALAPTGQQ